MQFPQFVPTGIQQNSNLSDFHRPKCENCGENSVKIDSKNFHYICIKCNCLQQNMQFISNFDPMQQNQEEQSSSQQNNNSLRVENQDFNYHPLFENDDSSNFIVGSEQKKSKQEDITQKYKNNVELIEKKIKKIIRKIPVREQNEVLRNFYKKSQNLSISTFTPFKLEKIAALSVYQVYQTICLDDNDTILSKICSKFPFRVNPDVIKDFLKGKTFTNTDISYKDTYQSESQANRVLNAQFFKTATKTLRAYEVPQQVLQKAELFSEIIYKEQLYSGQSETAKAGAILYLIGTHFTNESFSKIFSSFPKLSKELNTSAPTLRNYYNKEIKPHQNLFQENLNKNDNNNIEEEKFQQTEQEQEYEM